MVRLFGSSQAHLHTPTAFPVACNSTSALACTRQPSCFSFHPRERPCRFCHPHSSPASSFSTQALQTPCCTQLVHHQQLQTCNTQVIAFCSFISFMHNNLHSQTNSPAASAPAQAHTTSHAPTCWHVVFVHPVCMLPTSLPTRHLFQSGTPTPCSMQHNSCHL